MQRRSQQETCPAVPLKAIQFAPRALWSTLNPCDTSHAVTLEESLGLNPNRFA